MNFKRLKTFSELNAYRNIAANYIDVLFPLEYLERSKVYAWLDKNGEILGGFMIVTKGPFRVLNSIPDYADAKPLCEKEVAEITGVFLSSSLRGRQKSFEFWMRLYWKLILAKRKYYVYSYTLKKPQLQRMYSMTQPSVLFKGKTNQLAGMTDVEYESVEFMTFKNLVKVPLHRPQFFTRRLVAGRELSAVVPHRFASFLRGVA
jgi:hypothetical protein